MKSFYHSKARILFWNCVPILISILQLEATKNIGRFEGLLRTIDASHGRFMAPRHTPKSLAIIWPQFSYLLDERISKICRKLKLHYRLLSYRQNSTTNSAHLPALFCLATQKSIIEFEFHSYFWDFLIKVENIFKGSLDSIPSPSPSGKIQIMGGKVCLRCKGKTLLGVVDKLLKTKGFAFTPQANFPAHNLNFHWRRRWWDWIQATF